MQPLKISLSHAKSTKGTHVYDMKTEAGVSMGSVYLPKLVVGEAAPPALVMSVSLPKPPQGARLKAPELVIPTNDTKI